MKSAKPTARGMPLRVVVIGMTPIGTIALLLALLGLLLAPICYALLLWIKVLGAREVEM
jgi:hypothetical protein